LLTGFHIQITPAYERIGEEIARRWILLLQEANDDEEDEEGEGSEDSLAEIELGFDSEIEVEGADSTEGFEAEDDEEEEERSLGLGLGSAFGMVSALPSLGGNFTSIVDEDSVEETLCSSEVYNKGKMKRERRVRVRGGESERR